MTAVILQSDYLPWKGYFHLIRSADVCLFYDCVQYTRRDWRNRNQVYQDGRKTWISVPVLKAPMGTPIHAMRIANDRPWQRHHLFQLAHAYARATWRKPVLALLEPFLGATAPRFESLSGLNQALTRSIAAYLGIQTPFEDASHWDLPGRGGDRILAALARLGADRYLSGPSAASYLEPGAFDARGVRLDYMDYNGYMPYRQFSPVFDHHVSVVDLLFHAGPDAPRYIWGRP